jgi:uncharacterized protein YkwD
MRKYLALAMVLMARNCFAVAPLQVDTNPALYVPFANYYDAGSGQTFYYDPQANTFFVHDNAQQTPVAQATDVAQPSTNYGDPTGMLASVNYYRSLRGLHAWSFDSSLYNAAINNNAWQRIRGLGHHDVPSAQNSAWGQQDVMSVLNMWAASAGHAATLFGGYSAAAIAFDGVYWTLNAR